MDDFYCLLLASVPGIGPAQLKNLFSLCPTLDCFYQCPAHELHNHISDKFVLQEIIRRQTRPEKLLRSIDRQQSYLEKSRCKIITQQNKEFPGLLKEISSSPALLFVKGDDSVLKENQLGIVGTRKPTTYGKKSAQYFSSLASEAGLVVTSGLALGVDAISHQACVDKKAKTIAVMASGIDQIYPRRNQKLADEIVDNGGALITEFPPGFDPVKNAFPRRNRIISGLSLGVLVVEAALKSGSLITAKYALEQNREVFAVPGSVFNPLSQGCHQLVRQGAVLVENAQQIIDEICPGIISKQHSFLGTPQKDFSALDKEESAIMDLLAQDPIDIESLLKQTQMPLSSLQVLLIKLELKGLIERTGIHISAM